MFGAEQRISKRSSARAVQTRRHTPATQNVWLEARVCICNRPVIVYGNPTTDRKATMGKWIPTQDIILMAFLWCFIINETLARAEEI